VLHKVYRKVDEIGKVEPIKPDNGLVIPTFLAGSFLPMIMPIPGGSDYDVAGPHWNSFAMDCRKATGAVDDESTGKCGVPMGRCCLIRLY